MTSKLEKAEIAKKILRGDFELLITPDNLDFLNCVLPEHLEVVYHDGGFWLRLRKVKENE